MSTKDYKKFKAECTTCQVKFDIWFSMSNFNLGQEKIIRKNFYYHCPTCKIIKGIKRSI